LSLFRLRGWILFTAKQIFKKIWSVFVVLVVLAAALSGVARIVSPWVSGYRAEIEIYASKKLAVPVEIHQIAVGWYYFEPIVRLSGLTVLNEDHVPAVQIKKAAIGINLLSSLWHWSLQPGIVMVSNAKINIQHLQEIENSQTNAVEKPLHYWMEWILDRHKIVVQNVEIQFPSERDVSLVLSQGYFRLVNLGETHRIEAQFNWKEKTEKTSAHFYGNAVLEGNPQKIENCEGHFFISVDAVELPEWFHRFRALAPKIFAERLPPVHPIKGTGNVKLTGNFSHNRINRLKTHLTLNHLDVINIKTRKHRIFSEIAADLLWENKPGLWVFEGKDERDRSVMLQYNSRKQLYALSLKHFDLETINRWADFLDLDIPQIKLFRRYAFSGGVNTLHAEFSKEGWSLLSADIQNLSWKSDEKIPGIKGFSFKIELQPDEGQLEVNSKNLALDYPRWFDRDVPFSAVHANISWKKTDDIWQVVCEQLMAENAFFSADTQFNWQSTGSFIQLNSQFSINDVKAVKAFLPNKLFKTKLRNWLNQSILSAKRATGKLVLKGNLKDFPFDKNPNEGLFLVDSTWSGFNLDYYKGWPLAKNMDAHLVFKNRDMLADVHSVMIDDIALQNLKVSILDLGHDKETLDINGNIETDAANARHFILNSPLKDRLTSFQNLDIKGPVNLAIDIQIPLYSGNNTNLVKGEAEFKGNDLILPKWWKLHLKHLKGPLSFNQGGILQSKMTADLFGYPMRLSMRSDKSQTTQVDIEGDLGMDAIRNIFDSSVLKLMQGVTAYQAKLLLTASEKDADTLSLKTDLKGIAIDLPSPYGKTSDQAKPLDLKVKFSEVLDTEFSFEYANLLSVKLGFNKENNLYHFKNGEIHFGSQKIHSPYQKKGFKLSGSLPEFSWAAWQPTLKQLIQQDKNNPKEAGFLKILNDVDVNIGKTQWLGQWLSQAYVRVVRNAGSWALKIKSNEISGEITIPNDLKQGILANLDYLYLNFSDKGRAVKSSFEPKQIPPLNIHIKQFRYHDLDLGELDLSTQTTNNTLTIKQAALKSPVSECKLNGEWISKNGKSSTEIQGYFISTDIEKTLTSWKLHPAIKGKKAQVNFHLNWPDSPDNFKLASLNGSGKMLLNQGVITHLDKETQEKVGLGKLLSILSLQTLPRRLTLDFSDLSSDGLSFDTFQGDFVLRNGEMSSQNSYLDGPVAYVSMKGSLDLARKEYDLILKVAPHVTASLPVVATIAGGPIVGIATWVANKIVNQGMKFVSAYTYKVTGPWANPVIQQLSITEVERKPK